MSREDIFRDFTQESFEASAREYFAIEWRRPVADTGRTLYLMRSLNGARSGWSSTGAAEASAPRVDTVSGT